MPTLSQLVQAVDADLILESEFRFHPTRKWRFDFALPTKKLAIEIEGAVWIQGRHSRGGSSDWEKYAEATILGWRILRIPSHWLRGIKGMEYIRRGIES